MAKKGKKATPSWVGACTWLKSRMEEICKLLLVAESKLGLLHQMPSPDVHKWCRQVEALKQQLTGFCKTKRRNTPFPQADGSKISSLWERAQEVCQTILGTWQLSAWYLGANLWRLVQAIIKEAEAHIKQQTTKETKERKEKHDQWAETAVQKGAGTAHRASN